MTEDNRLITETDIQTAVEIPMYGKKNVILDSQILTALMNCPRYSDFRFNHNLLSIKGKSNSLECGSIVHKYLEVYYLCLIRGLDKKQAHGYGMTAAELYIRGCPECTDFTPIHNTQYDEVGMGHHCHDCKLKPSCGHKVNDYPGVKNTPVETEGYKTGWKWALQTCEQYNEFYKNDFWVPLEVETVKSKVLYEDDEVRVLWKAKLDLVSDTNQGIYPIDHKTMKQRRATSKLNNQFIGQCMVMGTRNVIINKVGFQTTLEPKDRFERHPVSYSAAALAEWTSETLPFYAKLLLMYAEGGYYPPNYSNCEGKYGPCPFKSVCESDPAMREEELKNNFIVGPAWNPTNDEDE